MSERLTYLSVCSGIEAATVAWHPLGWTPVAFSEIDKFPSAVLAHHYPHVPNWGDMTKFKEWPDAAIDLLVGGTPCQSFSVAGLRKGLADPRGNLMLTYLAIAERYRPTWLVWENVPGVLSSGGGRDFGSFLGALVELGYGFVYRVLDAQYFGLAQRRQRVFVVGCLGNWQRAAAVLLERASLSGHPAPRREAGKAAPTIPSRRSAGGGLGIDFDCDGGLIARCISTGEGNRQDYETTTLVAHSLRADGFDASEDGTGRGTPLVPVANSLAANSGRMQVEQTYVPVAFDSTQITSKTNRSNPKPGDPCHPLAAGAHAPAIAFDCKASGRNGFGVGEIASTQRAMGHTGSHTSGGGHQAVATGMQVRRLTPRECERLQGFPDDYTLIPLHNKKPSDALQFSADGPRYKALGNSMAVPVMSWVGRRIQEVEAICTRAKNVA